MRFALCVVLSVFVVTPAWAQTPSATTLTGMVTKGTDKVFTFTPATYGQVTATLSWDTQAAKLIMVLACGGSEGLSFGVAAGLLDRIARFESGVIGGEPCAIAVSTLDESANFRLHVVRSGDQFLTATATGFAALTSAREGTFLGDEALRTLNRLKQLLR